MINQQLEEFEKNGWIVVRNLISPEDVQLINNKISAVNADFDKTVGTDKLKQRTALMLSNPKTSKIVLKIAKIEFVHSFFKLKKMAPVIEHTKVLIKASGGPMTPWHQDSGYWRSFDPERTMFTVWVALMEIGPEQGCMRVLEAGPNVAELPHKPVHEESERAIQDDTLGRLGGYPKIL